MFFLKVIWLYSVVGWLLNGKNESFQTKIKLYIGNWLNVSFVCLKPYLTPKSHSCKHHFYMLESILYWREMEKIEETRFLKCATMLRKDNLSNIWRGKSSIGITYKSYNIIYDKVWLSFMPIRHCRIFNLTVLIEKWILKKGKTMAQKWILFIVRQMIQNGILQQMVMKALSRRVFKLSQR